MAVEPDTVRYFVTGMDCADCVAKIEKTARQVPGVDGVKVSLTSQTLTLRNPSPDALTTVEQAVTALGYQLDRQDAPDGDDGVDRRRAITSPAYRRALWIVVLLNVGYGLIEIVGGFLSDSQALKADALDFVGDGLISFLGLLAIGWRPVWRARSALIQGLFLGLLGLGVLGNTVYRLIVQTEPEAELMGLFGIVALVVNVVSVLVLLPHRAGDANVRAVWLFSRNDALGNLAVVIAAGLVALTGTAWPDLAVAFVIAGLFLHSAWSIITDARSELATAT
jgi:Co/Zn/Cd efflux system component/copper chaperone CopZ